MSPCIAVSYRGNWAYNTTWKLVEPDRTVSYSLCLDVVASAFFLSYLVILGLIQKQIIDYCLAITNNTITSRR